MTRASTLSWLGAVLLVVTTTVDPRAQSGELVVTSPTEQTLLVGITTFTADVRPDSIPVSEVEFFLDGESVCRARQRPFACSRDVGTRLVERTVRVVATLADGRRLTQSLRTTGMAVNEAVDVDAIVVSVRVTDRSGRFVTGLTRDHFRLVEDGLPQEISGFAAEDGAASVVVALDVSGSMAPAIGELRRATGLFLDSMRPQDLVTVSAFNTSLAVIARPGDAGADRVTALEQLRPSGETALFDSLIRASDLFGPGGGQRAVVVFTDGQDVASRGTPAGARTALHVADVGLYVIAQGAAAEDGALRQRLGDLARETGGAAYFSSRMSSLQEHFAEIAEDLAHRYVLTFTPIRPLGDGGWRQLTVQLVGVDGGHHVRAREGYLAVRRTRR